MYLLWCSLLRKTTNTTAFLKELQGSNRAAGGTFAKMLEGFSSWENKAQ